MKYIIKVIPFVIFFVVVLLRGQTYEFNKEVIYTSEYDGKKNDLIAYINTNNNNYYLKIRRTHDGLLGVIYDYDKNKIHHYKILEQENKNYKMEYMYSKNFLNRANYNRFGYELTENGSQKVWSIYNNKRMKHIFMKFEFYEQENNENLFPAFRICCLHPFEVNKNLSLQDNVIIKSSKIFYNGNSFDCRLKNIDDINIIVTIPQQ